MFVVFNKALSFNNVNWGLVGSLTISYLLLPVAVLVFLARHVKVGVMVEDGGRVGGRAAVLVPPNFPWPRPLARPAPPGQVAAGAGQLVVKSSLIVANPGVSGFLASIGTHLLGGTQVVVLS